MTCGDQTLKKLCKICIVFYFELDFYSIVPVKDASMADHLELSNASH